MANLTPDLDTLAAAIGAAFPEVEPVAPLTLLGRGIRSTVVRTCSGVAVAIGRRPRSALEYAFERRMLPLLAPRLAVAVPEPRWYAAAGDAFPFGALGYPVLPGTTPRAATATLAASLGGFLAELHHVPLEVGRAAGLPDIDALARQLVQGPPLQDFLRAAFTREQFARVERWWDGLAVDERMRSPRRVVCHHDLWRDNLLVDQTGALCGVLDWTDCEIADPANEFAALHRFGPRFVQGALAAYRARGGVFGPDDAYRAERYWQGWELVTLAWCLEDGDVAEAHDSVRKLLRGPIFAPLAPTSPPVRPPDGRTTPSPSPSDGEGVRGSGPLPPSPA